MSRGMELGQTDSGRDWCLKALHPSDPLTEVRGIPDRSAVPSAFINYQSVFNLSPAAGATGTWAFDGTLLPHPVGFMNINKLDSVGSSFHDFMNGQLTGATHTTKVATFRGLAERWRLAYMAVTIHQDGPALSDQGTIVVAQVPCKPRTTSVSCKTVGNVLQHSVLLESYQTNDIPDYDYSQALPNAYFNNSRQGAYVPLKLTKTCQQWHGTEDTVGNTGQNVGDVGGLNGIATALETTNGMCSFPFTNLGRAYSATGVDIIGETTVKLCNDVVAHISGRNLSVATSFTFFVRAGFEIQVEPHSVYAPNIKLSPPHDKTALNAYFAIAREMKDAYPADYNDLGKIWDVISGVAKSVAPALSMIPGFGMPLSAAVGGAASVGDMIRNAISDRAEKSRVQKTLAAPDKASAGDIELTRQAMRLVKTRRTMGKQSKQRKPIKLRR
jgi:hypothetical protein